MNSLYSSLSKLTNIRDPKDLLNLEDSKDIFPVMLWWKDLNNIFLGSNTMHAADKGLTSGKELIGLDSRELWPQDTETILTNDKRVLFEKKPLLFIEHSCYPTHHSNNYLSYKMPLTLNSKKIIGIIGVAIIIKELSSISDLLASWGAHEKTKKPEEEPSLLTRRQMTCLYHLTKGLRAKEIARALNLSPRTIEHHIEAIKRKLNCYTRGDLVARALQMPEIKNKL